MHIAEWVETGGSVITARGIMALKEEVIAIEEFIVKEDKTNIFFRNSAPFMPVFMNMFRLV